MSPKVSELTPEQRTTIRELQTELKALDLEADEQWKQWIETGDVDCFNRVQGLDSEIEMKGMIAYIPKGGEVKISKIKKLVNKVRESAGEQKLGRIGIEEGRLRTMETINMFREDIGLPKLDRMPQGVLGNSSECTIARALSWDSGEAGIKFDGVHVAGTTSDDYVSFTRNGLYEQYKMTPSHLAGLRAIEEGLITVPDTVPPRGSSLFRTWLHDALLASVDGVVYDRLYAEARADMDDWVKLVSQFDSALYLDLVEDESLTSMFWHRFQTGDYGQPGGEHLEHEDEDGVPYSMNNLIKEGQRRGEEFMGLLAASYDFIEITDGKIVVKEPAI